MAKVKFFPEEQRVLVLPKDQGNNKTSGGIIIPGGSDEKPEMAEVIRVGKGSEDRPMKYKVGQTVMYSQYSGVKVSFDLEGPGYNEYKLMNQIDIMGIIEEVE